MTVETLHPHKSRVGAGGLPHLGHDLRRLRAGVVMHHRRLRSGGEHMQYPAGGVGVGWWTRQCHRVGVGTFPYAVGDNGNEEGEDGEALHRWDALKVLWRVWKMTVEILYLYKARTTSRSNDAPPPPVKRLEALAGSGWRSGSRLVDAAVPPYRSGNLFVATNLKLDSSSRAGIFGHLSNSFLRRKDSLMVVCALNAIFLPHNIFSKLLDLRHSLPPHRL
ncbi:hypothetical protein HN51_031315 [Arachis hypogaea]